MKKSVSTTTRSVDRRSFMKNGLLAGGAATVGVGLLAKTTSAQERGRLKSGRCRHPQVSGGGRTDRI
jgi:hypothetical protein